MPEYQKPSDGDWIRRTSWETVRKELKLHDSGADCRSYGVRTSALKGDEARADTHPETRDVFRPPADATQSLPEHGPAPESTTRARESRPARGSGPALGIETFREDVERANAEADYHHASADRRRWILDWLDAGADPDKRGPGGWTPLHFAAAGDWPEKLWAALLDPDVGADPNVRNDTGSTPLHLAASYASADVATALLRGGAYVDVKDANGLMPLHLAARDGGPEIIKVLIDADAELDARTPKGMTPLHLAATSGTAEAVKVLSAARADVNARTEKSLTPLHVAASRDRPRTVAAELLQAGADVAARAEDGWTPLQMAAAKSGHELVRVLLVAGADVHAKNDHGSTALELAERYQKTNQVASLLRRAGRDDPHPARVESRISSRVWSVAVTVAVLAGFGYFFASIVGPGSDPSSDSPAGGVASNPAPPTSDPPPVIEPARPDPPPVIEPVRIGGAVPRPRKTWHVAVEYPRMAMLRRIQGIVILQVTVDRQGEVSDVSVLRSTEGLDEAAIAAVRRWRYEPTVVNGMPVSAIFTEAVRFQIET